MPKIKDLQNIDFSNYERVLPDKPISAPDQDDRLIATIRQIVRDELNAWAARQARPATLKNQI